MLRKPGRIGLVVVDSGGQVVRTLLDSGFRPKGLQTFSWNGRDDAGQVVPAGTYKPRIHLSREHRTILMPNPITVDPTPPRITAASIAPRAFSPDGDGRRDIVRIHYRATEPSRALVYVNGRRRVRTKRYAETGVARWFGTGAAAGPVQADAPNDGPRRERLCAGRSRRRPDPVHLGWAARPARASRRRGSASAS